jgi:CBS domain-containing protein
MSMRVKDFMTGPVVTVRADTAVQEAARLLVSHGYSVLPAVHGDNGLLGPSAPDLASAGLPALMPLRSGDDPRVG